MRQRINASICLPILTIILITEVMAGGVYGLKSVLPDMPAWQSLVILMAASMLIYAPLVFISGMWRRLKA
jgi:hypothetical protein